MIKRVILDIFFYLGVPLLVWNIFKEDLGEYYAILFGMVPALVYTIIKFILKKEWNVTGIFFLSIISLNFIFNVLSENAEQELWNGVYMAVLSIVFYVITILAKSPIGIYFFIDYAHAKGVPRKNSSKLYRSPENYHHFVKFTLFLVLREAVIGVVKSILILEKGVQGFNTIQITSSVLSYVFTGLTIVYVIYILKQIKNQTKTKNNQKSNENN